MKSIILKGVEVKIGDKVRFIDNRNLYTEDYDGFNNIIKPELGKIYSVRGFTNNNGFYLDEIVNSLIQTAAMGYTFEVEPGFGIYRFEPANPLVLEVEALLKSKKKVNITISPEIIETLEERLELVN
jgi:hypothetical protein